MDPNRFSEKNSRSVIVEEFEFANTVTGRLRQRIHQLAGKWALRFLIQQQNEINLQQNRTGKLLKESLQNVDHDLVETRRQVAELTAIVIQQQKTIEKLETQIGRQQQTEETEE